MLMKITVLYGHPENPDAFERHYANKHLPLASRLRGLTRVELTLCETAPDGVEPAFYRMAELYFDDRQQMERSLSSAVGRALVDDLAHFATGGVTVLVGSVA